MNCSRPFLIASRYPDCTRWSWLGYTSDGSNPTTTSAVYSSAINISATTTLKFFATDLAGNSAAVKSETYTISTGTSTVTVVLKDSSGNPLSGDIVRYYSKGWKFFGKTDTSGKVSKELWPGNYTFRMTYAFAHEEKSQDVAADATVVFQTGQVHSDSGRCTHYYGHGCHAFTQDMQLLQGTYTFRFKGRPENRSYRITAGTVNQIR